uniref:Titin n=1 Tax=Pygocentrus nattereri TaxID=42514 RepID=A0AAR2KKU6_PYGNA
MKASFTNVIETQFTITGLTEGAKYDFRVIAKNAVGTISKPSYNSGPIVALDEVEPPKFSIDPEYTQTLIVNAGDTFKIDADVHGKPVPTIQWFKGDKEIENTIRCEIKNTDTRAMIVIKDALRQDGGNYTLQLTNVAGSQTVSFHVKVLDKPSPPEGPLHVTGVSTGISEPSLPTSYYKASDPKYKPGPPTNAHVIDTTKSSISVTWGKPLNDGGSAIQGYIVEICKAEEEEWSMCTPPTGLRVNKFEITKLTEQQEYKVQVCAINKLAPEIHLDSELRKGIVVRAGGSVRINVPFKGRPTPEINWTKDEGELSEKAVIEKGLNFTQLSIDSCDRKDSGKYTLTLQNSSGSVSEFVAVKVLDTPGAPQNLVVKDIKKDSVTLVWDAPLIDGGAKIKNYVVDKRESTRKAYANVTGGIFYFRVCAVNEYGIGVMVETKNPVKVAQVPMPPGKVTLVDVTKNSVTLTWVKPAHDGGSKVICYNVEMQPKGTDKWGVCCTVKVPEATAGDDLTIEVPVRGRPKPVVSWKKDSLPLKQTTSLTIINTMVSSKIVIKEAAIDHVGKYELTLANTAGTFSTDINIVVLDKPGPPASVKVDAVTADSITLSWTPPEYDGGCSINNYIVEKRDTNTTVWQIVSTNVARNSIKVSRLTHGSEYQFRIYAVNRYGKSKPIDSPGITAEYTFKQPGPPATPRVAHSTKSFMLVTWNEPVNDGGSTVLGYHLERKERREVKTRTWKVTKLLKGNEYIFRVLAVNKFGLGEPLESEIVKIIDPFTVAAAPTNVEITSVTSEEMTITWAKPIHDGGSEICGYVIERHEKSSLRWVRVNRELEKDLTAIVPKLRRGCEYEFRVFAENAAGLSPPSQPSASARAEDALLLPSPPTKPKILDHTKNSITIVWNKPLSDGGTPIIGYTVEYKKAEDEEWVVAIQMTRSTEFTVSGLTSDVEYVFAVKSINKIGLSERSPVSEPQVATDRKEEPIFDVDIEMRKTLIVKHGNSFTLTAPFKGVPVPSVTWNKEEVDLKSRATIETTGTYTSLTIEKATRNDSGQYTVTLDNGIGTASLPVIVKVLDSPGPPINVKVKEVTKDSATLTWEVPENDGGDAVKAYHVEKREASKKAWVCVTNNCRNLVYKVEDLQEGAIYYFRVMGENEFGMGVPAETKEGTKITGKFYVRAGSNLKFELPLTGKPMPKVAMTRNNVPVKCGKRFSFEVTPESLNINLKESIASDAGRYDIVASNTSGTTKMFINILVLDRPGPPVGPVAISDVGETSVCLKWLPPVYDGGSPVTNYVILRRETSTPAWVEVSSTVARSAIKVTKLTKGEEYQFRIKAENRFGISDHIDSQTVTVKLPYSEYLSTAF